MCFYFLYPLLKLIYWFLEGVYTGYFISILSVLEFANGIDFVAIRMEIKMKVYVSGNICKK